MRIRLNSFDETTTSTREDARIIIVIGKVKYNYIMSSQSLTVLLQDSNGCTIARGTNTESWIPSRPALFKTLSLAFSTSNTVYTYATDALVLRAQLPYLNPSGKLITIEIIGTDASIEQSFTSGEIVITESTSTLVKGLIKSWVIDLLVILTPFVSPINEKPFYAKVSVYYGTEEQYSEILYQQSTAAISATRTNIANPGNVKSIASNFVDELGTYTVMATIPYEITEETEFHYTLPNSYNATEACMGSSHCILENDHTFIITNLENITLDNNVVTFTIYTRNPPTIKPITEKFSIVGYKSGYPSFSVITNLDPNVEYKSGELKDLTVKNLLESAYDLTVYTISFTTNHKVLAGSDMVFQFPQAITTRWTTIKSVTINGVVVNAESVTGSLIISKAFSTDITTPSSVKVQFDNVRNPITYDTYSGFSVTAKYQGYAIDSAFGGSIRVNSPGTLPASYELSNWTNGVTADYTFTLYSLDPLPSYSDTSKKQIEIHKPTIITTCDFTRLIGKDFQISYVSGVEPALYDVQYSSTKTSISFTMTCLNPKTTEPTDPFIVTLFLYVNSNRMECTNSYIQIETRIGFPLIIPNELENIPTYPSYATISKVTIKRNEIEVPIDEVIVKVPYPLIPAPSPACTVDLALQYSCVLNSNGNLIIVFESSWTSSTLTIAGMTSINPLSKDQSTIPFSVKTYTKANSNYYVVDQADNAGFLKVTCTYPCKECLSDETACTSCVNNDPNKIFYLIKQENTCKPDSENVCGKGYFKNTTEYTCDNCASKCTECVNTASYCTYCSDPTLVAMKGECKRTCDEGFFHPIDWNVCSECAPECKLCANARDNCSLCTAGHYFHNNHCLSTCPEKTYKVDLTWTCDPCDADKCYSCVDSATYCTSCIETKYLESDTHVCVSSCSSNYYVSGKQCIKCSDSCLTCAGGAEKCTSCGRNLYLYINQCMVLCPDKTYASEGLCKSCNQNCYTCSIEATHCTSCGEEKVLDGNLCTENCRDGMIEVKGVCTSCDYDCKTCVNSSSTCTSCNNTEKYLYLSRCYITCPSGTLETVSNQMRLCTACNFGCLDCYFGNDNNKICHKCEVGYKLLNGECTHDCPEDYQVNEDGTLCLSIIPSRLTYVPFPFLIAFVIYLVIPFAGWIRNSNSLLIVNLIIGWSAIMFIAFIVQAILAIINTQKAIFGVSLVAVVTTIALNLSFYFPYRVHVLSDQGFSQWLLTNTCAARLISILSYIFSFQLRRLYYSRFSGLNFFFIGFTDIKYFLNDLNYFSIGYILFSLLPVCIIDLYAFIVLDWGSQLLITAIETFVVSIFILCLILYEAKYGREFSREEYSGLSNTDSMTKQKMMDDIRQNVIENVMKEINIQKGNKLFKSKNPRRTYTMPNLWPNEKKVIKKAEVSYPCSPRVRDEVYSFYKEEVEGNTDLEDNVIAEAVDGEKLAKGRLMLDDLVQTIPIVKIKDFANRLLNDLKPKKRKSRLFESINPPDSILELSSKNRKVFPKNNVSTTTPFNNEETLQKQDFLPDEFAINDNENLSLRNTRKTFLDGNKTPDIFDSSNKFKFSMVCLEKATEDNGDKTDINDILGSFDRDENNAIVISQTIDGKLLDKRGKVVNQLGYLIDENGNIISNKGEFILSKEDFERELKVNNADEKDNKEKEQVKKIDLKTINVEDERQEEFSEERKVDFMTLNADILSRSDIKLDMVSEKNALNTSRRDRNLKAKLNNEAKTVYGAFEIEKKIHSNGEEKSADNKVMTEWEGSFMEDSPSKYDEFNKTNYQLNSTKQNMEEEKDLVKMKPIMTKESKTQYKKEKSSSRNKNSLREKKNKALTNSKGESITPIFVSQWRKRAVRKGRKENPNARIIKQNQLPNTNDVVIDVDSGFKVLQNKIAAAKFPEVNDERAFEFDSNEINVTPLDKK